MKYKSKPKVIEAFQFRIDNCPDWFMDKVSNNDVITTESECYIRTLEGWMLARKGDFIIKGIHSELYPCKPDIFHKSYELIDDKGE